MDSEHLSADGLTEKPPINTDMVVTQTFSTLNYSGAVNENTLNEMSVRLIIF